jgi:D-cysteine desulfhydrase
VPRLHERFPALRVTLGHGPTPVRPLDGLAPGVPIWMKDEGAYGDGGWGGNKIRKLEWILPDVRRRGARTILTFGGLGTNHGLATALYARDHGLRCAIALLDQPVDDQVRAQLARLERSGATLYRTHTKARTIAALPWLLARHTIAGGGRPPYLLPVGGSSPVGALGYVEAALELAEQVRDGALPEPTHVVCALGSGGTTAGLALGLRLAGLRTRVVGVLVNDKLRLDPPAIAKLANRTASLLRDRGAALEAPPVQPGDITVVTDQLGAGYGHATEAARQALALAADRGGLSLELVYTAKTLAGVLAGRDAGAFGEGPVLFLQTHGPRAGGPDPYGAKSSS